jgi:glutaredoxin
MRVQLLVSEWCVPCRAAERTWRAVAEERAIAFEVLDVGQPEGRAVVARLGVRTVPATVIDGELKHVGVPTLAQARELVAAAPARPAGAARYVGLTLEATSAWAVAAAALYLVAAGAALVAAGGIAGDAPWRAAAVHAFGLGFVAFFIFGLGEHLLARFTGRPIRAGALAWVQQALGHAGAIGVAAGLAAGERLLALAAGALAWAALAVFAARIVPLVLGSTAQTRSDGCPEVEPGSRKA